MELKVYRRLLSDPLTRRFLAGLAVSALGDGLSTVTIAWLALRVAPPDQHGLFVGLAVAAYTLPGVIGALALGRYLRARPARHMLLVHCLARAVCLGSVAILALLGALPPYAYVALLAGSSLLVAWGNAGQYTMLSTLGGPYGRLAVNSLASAQVSFATIVGPLVAGVLLALIGPGWLIGFDAASFAVLALVAIRIPDRAVTTGGPVDTRAAQSGYRLIMRRDLLTLMVVTWVFFFLYGPVEVALPVFVADDRGAPAGLLGAYWTCFGLGALASSLVTGTLRHHDLRRVVLLIVAGWGLILLPFGGAPIPVTVFFFALGGVIYGPFIPLTYALFQSSVPTDELPSVLAARSAIVMLSTPVGTALGGPLVAGIGATSTLVASGVGTILLAVVAAVLWKAPASDVALRDSYADPAEG